MKKLSNEELLKNAINERLYRRKVWKITSRHEYNLYYLELDNNNITQTELEAISEVVGDYDLQVDAKRYGEYGVSLVVTATIDDGKIDEIRERM